MSREAIWKTCSTGMRPHYINLQRAILKRVIAFIYLGSRMAEDGVLDVEIIKSSRD